MFKIGEIITAYHSGYHKVVDNPKYVYYPNQIYYTLVADANGKPRNGKRVRSCHKEYCKKLTRDDVYETKKAEIILATQKADNLLKILENSNGS